MFVFLDIDGVMVPAKGWKLPDLLPDGFPAFSGKATLALRDLLSKEDTLVLTTSHKERFSIEEWKRIFTNRGIQHEKIVSLPHNAANHSRKDEITNWFILNRLTDDFVIIDDDTSLHELPQFLKEHWVQTSPYIGLTEEHLKSVKATAHYIPQPA